MNFGEMVMTARMVEKEAKKKEGMEKEAKKKKGTEKKVGPEVGRLEEKRKEVEDRKRMKDKTEIMGLEEELDEKVENGADQDRSEMGVVVVQGRRSNQDQLSRERGDEVKAYPCPNCYNMFPSVEVLTTHFKNCYAVNPEFKASHEMAELKGGVSKKVVHDRMAGEDAANGVKVVNAANPFDCGACGKVLHIKNMSS